MFNPLNSQMLELSRQRKMADLLTSQGLQTPQAQNVSGIYVPPNPMEYIAKLYGTYQGTQANRELDTREQALAKALRQQQTDELSQYQNLLNPRQTELAGPTPTGAPLTTVNVPDRQAANLFAASAYNPALQAVGIKNLTQGPKFEKASFTDEKTGKVREGVMDMNAPNPIDTFQVGGVKPEMSAYERASLKLRAGDQAISSANLFYNTGMTAGGGGMPMGAPMVNAPAGAPMNAPMGGASVAGGMPTANAPASQDKFAPAVQPQYQYNPSISPKANQEAAAKFGEELAKNQRNAKDSFDLMKSASSLLSSEAPSSGRLSNIATGVGEFFGSNSEASKADARLNLLSSGLTMKQPRFEGPQGVLDVTLYQKAAGDLGNPNLPIATRLAAIEEMIELQKKYYPQGDWDSISTKTKTASKIEAAKSAGKVSVGAPQYARNPQTGQRIVSTDGGINWKPVGGN